MAVNKLVDSTQLDADLSFKLDVEEVKVLIESAVLELKKNLE